MSADVKNDTQKNQYELTTPEGMAVAVYRTVGTHAVMFTHTEVPEALEGQGIGSKLVKAALEDVKAQGKMVIPMCPFVAGYISQHHEYLDLVDPVQRGALNIS
ncbi:N-acetyltransferase [Deinococcus sp. KNUC1210]|uniref:GNAT family N-acetyltransferase n=1 Tax=Deinococcus sp. KNUC1210 TaxID=2917691 RepID=UPI001EEF9970|nr:GNAT family N-acetyltransferase [Deinococcus sp. KNUC1210]ULH14393.1 N-acetyltransferase [Deinococcus sp. KNUC1210]